VTETVDQKSTSQFHMKKIQGELLVIVD